MKKMVCPDCNSNNLTMKEGKNGIFIGCNNSPKCKKTITLKQYIEDHGFNIYTAKLNCWKCTEEIDIYCWNITKQFSGALTETFNCELYGPDSIGDGQLKFMTDWMIDNIPTIKLKWSNTLRRKYAANVCQKCDSLQGAAFLFSKSSSPFWEMGESVSVYKNVKIKG